MIESALEFLAVLAVRLALAGGVVMFLLAIVILSAFAETEV